MTSPLSLRLPETTVSRLGERAQVVRMPPRTLAQRYVEEGLRMDEHPMIYFADGPSGRRARLAGSGLDVWEAIEVIGDNGGDVAAAAEYIEIDQGRLQAAVTYYGAFREEIDQLIELNERAAREAEAAWRAGLAAISNKSAA